ncbi:MAG TPA: ABC transporter permease, partial [Bryobacteraceae bacterium]|nr:ABC transporter permease [Bryobacteraceae bacterium]
MWRRKRSLNDFSDEIRSHLEHEADDLRTTGGHADAAGEARRAFGNITRTREAFYEHGRLSIRDSFTRDLRHALRLFRRRPALSGVIVLTLAIGIGANSAIFGLINAVLLRPLPYREPQNLAMLWSQDVAHGRVEGRVSLLNFADWKRKSHSFEDMTLFIGQTFLLGNRNGPPERMRSARVSANFLPMLGIEPVLGRSFTTSEESRGERVVLLSYSLWQRNFGGSADAIGADLLMDGRKSRIIGVMPASFQYPFADTQVWEPLTAHPYWASRDRDGGRSASNWYVLARLGRGSSWAQAQGEMEAIAQQLAAQYPEDRNLPDIAVVPLDVQTTARIERPLLVLFASVFLMLLIACANVANLLLAEGSAREQEFSLRRALGASRVTLAWQLLIESLVLCMAGGAIGIPLAALSLKALVAFGPRDIPRLAEAHIDPATLLFTLGVSTLAALASGLWPAFRGGISFTRGRQWNTPGNRRLRNALVAAEFSIALVLLAGAGLMIKSFLRLSAVEPGFQPHNLLVMRVDLHVGRTADQQVAYFRDAIDRVQALPGVRSAGAIEGFLRSDPEEAVEIEGRPMQRPGPSEDSIEGAFFTTSGIAIERGRVFTTQDRRDSPPVAIVNQAAARAYWPGEDPIGKRFRFPSDTAKPWVTVVGVAGDMHRQGLENETVPQVFFPLAQQTDDMMEILVRTSSDAGALGPLVRATVQSIDNSVAKFDVLSVEQQLGEQTSDRRFQTLLL